MSTNPSSEKTLLRPVLYAEDEEDDVYFMQRAFRQAAVANALISVSDGLEAVDYLTGAGHFADRGQFPLPCLLLLDLNLPKKSGLEVLKWVRNDTTVSTLPVIVLTSSLQDADVHRAYVQGANAYLVKPSAPEGLVKLVENVRDFWLGPNRIPDKPWNALGGTGENRP